MDSFQSPGVVYAHPWRNEGFSSEVFRGWTRFRVLVWCMRNPLVATVRRRPASRINSGFQFDGTSSVKILAFQSAPSVTGTAPVQDYAPVDHLAGQSSIGGSYFSICLWRIIAISPWCVTARVIAASEKTGFRVVRTLAACVIHGRVCSRTKVRLGGAAPLAVSVERRRSKVLSAADQSHFGGLQESILVVTGVVYLCNFG